MQRPLFILSCAVTGISAMSVEVPPRSASTPIMDLTSASAAQAARMLEAFQREREPTPGERATLDSITLALLRAETALTMLGRDQAGDHSLLEAATEDRNQARRQLLNVPSASKARLVDDYRAADLRLRQLEQHLIDKLDARAGVSASAAARVREPNQ